MEHFTKIQYCIWGGMVVCGLHGSCFLDLVEVLQKLMKVRMFPENITHAANKIYLQAALLMALSELVLQSSFTIGQSVSDNLVNSTV